MRSGVLTSGWREGCLLFCKYTISLVMWTGSVCLSILLDYVCIRSLLQTHWQAGPIHFSIENYRKIGLFSAKSSKIFRVIIDGHRWTKTIHTHAPGGGRSASSDDVGAGSPAATGSAGVGIPVGSPGATAGPVKAEHRNNKSCRRIGGEHRLQNK